MCSTSPVAPTGETEALPLSPYAERLGFVRAARLRRCANRADHCIARRVAGIGRDPARALLSAGAVLLRAGLACDGARVERAVADTGRGCSASLYARPPGHVRAGYCCSRTAQRTACRRGAGAR